MEILFYQNIDKKRGQYYILFEEKISPNILIKSNDERRMQRNFNGESKKR